MKQEGKSWGDILAAINKQSKSQLQAHWKTDLENGEVTVPEQAGHSTNDLETYHAKDDKKIIGMKQSGKSWGEILEAIGKKSKSQLQAHWKNDLQDQAGDAPANPEQGKGKGDGKVRSTLLLSRRYTDNLSRAKAVTVPTKSWLMQSTRPAPMHTGASLLPSTTTRLVIVLLKNKLRSSIHASE
jgi:hypothetical protein